jgi:hypothetical protein
MASRAPRTPGEKRQARAEAKEYTATNDDKTYVVTKGPHTITVKGVNSAKAVAGDDGTYKQK